MTFIWYGLVGMVIGAVGHAAFYDLTERHFRVPDLHRYGVGVLITLPVFALFRHDDPDLVGWRSFVLSFMSVGLGVLAARLARKVWR